MLGLHVLPYDRIISGGQGHNMTSPSSTIFEPSSIGRHLIGAVNGNNAGGFRAYHRPTSSPTSFIDPFDLVSSSEDARSVPFYYRHRTLNNASSSEHQLANASRRLPPPPPLSSAPSGFMDQFNSYAVPVSYSGQGTCNQQQQQRILFDDQRLVRGHEQSLQLHHQQSQQLHQAHHQQQQQQQPQQQRSLALSSFDVINADHRQQRRLVGDHVTSSLMPVPTFFRSDDTAISSATLAGVSSASIGATPLTSTSASFDFYYGGCESPPSHRGSIYAPPPYRDAPPSFDSSVVPASNASGPDRTSIMPPAVPSSTTFPPLFGRTMTTLVSPSGGAVASRKVSSSKTSSLSSGSLTVDETTTTTNSESPSSPRVADADESASHRLLRGQPLKQRRRRTAIAVPPDRKDNAYYERRKKNNESARRSRESRQSKEQSTIDECHEAREHNTKVKIQIQLLQREYNEMCRSAYGRIGPVAASRLIAPPPPSSSYGYSNHLPSPGESGSYPTTMVPPGGIVDADRT